MKLRGRLVLAAAAVMAPMMAALLWFDASEKHRAAERMLTNVVTSRMVSGRARCEADPKSWGGRRDAFPERHDHFDRDRPPPPPPFEPGERPAPPPLPPFPPQGPPPMDGSAKAHARPAVVYAYDESFRSLNPEAPPLSPALVQSVKGRDVGVPPLAWRSSDVEVLVRTPWGTGPCAYVLGQGSTDPSWGAVLPDNPFWLLPMLAVLGAVLVAMGPIVRRIRKLEEAVQRSKSSSYSTAVAIGGRDEISDLALAFDEAGREIRSRIEEKDRREKALFDFVANTTHDVMIPLTVLQGHLATMRERAAKGEPVDPSVVVSAMDEAHYMGSLVHNLTTAARLEAADHNLERSAVDLNAVVHRVVSRHKPIARELGVALDSAVPDAPVLVSADVTLVEQAVSNVVYNAVRYNRAGGHVAIVLEATPDERFCLHVIDDGPGMTPEELERLKQRGARGNAARTRAPEGQGLGLDIAFRAAELHGFSLSLGPSEYGGLEVRLEGNVTLPPGRELAYGQAE